MVLNTEEKRDLRKYLLGDVRLGEKTAEIEERVMIEEKYFDALLFEEEELIQDYADNNLTAVERKNFEKNFLISPGRQEKLKFAQAFRKYLNRQSLSAETDTNTKERRNFRSILKSFLSPLPVAATVVVIVGLASVLGWHYYLRATESHAAMIALNRAYRIQRPLETRITNLDYAPFGQVRGESDTKIDIRESNRAQIISQDAAADHPTASNLHTLARTYLTKKDFNEALKEIEKAARMDSQNAEILSDTGVIYLEKSKTLSEDNGEAMELKAKALDYFDKAIAISPDLLAARFNKAIVLQTLNSPTEARKAWQDYLNLDADSQWAEEARQNLKRLESKQSQNKTSDEILRDFLAAYRANDGESAYRTTSRNREMITSKLIPQQLAFLFLKSEGAEKQDYLAALEYIGNLEREKSADSFFSEIAKFYATLPAEKQVGLSEAQDLIKQGYAFCLQNKNKEALTAFTRARAIFVETGNIWEAGISDYWIGYCLNRVNKIEESTIVLDELAEFCRNRNYKWLAAQAFSWLAINKGSVKEFSKAIEYNEKALYFAEETSDLYLTQKSLSQLSDIYRRSANYRQAIGFAFKTLTVASQPESSLRQKCRDYDAIANILFAMKYYAAALAYQKEALNLSIELNDSSFAFSSFIDFGRILATQGRYRESLDAFEKTRQFIESFSDEEHKKKSRAIVSVHTGHALRQAKNCEAALIDYDKAVEFFRGGEYQANLYDAHKGRLLCYYLNKNDSAFQSELSLILDLFRDYRTKILEEQNRNSFFDSEQSVYDIAIGNEFDKQDYKKAFDYSEESRARSLLDLQNSQGTVFQDGSGRAEIKFAANVTEPSNLAQIQAKMPADVQLIQYSVLSDKTLIWLITKEDLSIVETDISATDLQEKISDYLELLEKNDSFDTEKRIESAKQLYRILVTPIENKLDAGKQLCLIPDKILFRLSFAALISPDEEKYFVSRYKFFSAPSASIFLIDSEKAGRLRQNTPETLLSVGNPSFSRKDFAALPDLASSAREAEEIAAFYNEAILLTGKDASKEKFTKNLSGADVIHFAGHYVPNENSPLLSSLILAKNERTREPKDSVLANHEIIGAELSQAKLIVLSACQTGGERFYNGEGMTGAARTFLATGVPLVVASQWQVDSDATAELMIDFHRYRAIEKLSTVEALRRAQLDMMTGENNRFQNPYYWAGFAVLGGYAEF
jgi:CHAT domain-containing protein/cytochrome c-type biogenesis protein CcmH/NrfG